MKKILWTVEEQASITQFGETCAAVAKAAMLRSGFNFDDIEEITGHSESHNWGSNADRKYRSAAVNKAVAIVAANPMQYV